MAIHITARVEDESILGSGVSIWDHAVIREGSSIGDRTSIGIGAYVGPGVEIGRDCKIQNGAYLYEPAIIANGVFIGPRVILTNDRFPRAITVDGRSKSPEDWQLVGVVIEEGASIGAGAICVAPVKIGAWATVAAGSVVVRDVVPFALVGGVPARQLGWVGRHGAPLENKSGNWVCPETGEVYVEVMGGSLLELMG